MMKRAFAVALLGLGMSFAGQAPASAAAASISGAALPLAQMAGDSATRVGGKRACWWDVPVIGAGVAFFELLRDTEFDYHCSGHFHGEHYYRKGYNKRAYKTYK